MEWEGYNHTGVYNVLFMCLPFRHSCEVLPTHNNPGSIQNSVRMLNTSNTTSHKQYTLFSLLYT